MGQVKVILREDIPKLGDAGDGVNAELLAPRELAGGW